MAKVNAATVLQASSGSDGNKFVFSARSLKRLEGVHPDLVAVVKRAIEITSLDFTITEGLRSPKRQLELYNAGAARTLNSRHLTGHAIDVAALVGGSVRWDWPLYHKIAKTMKAAALELDIPVEWGGDWVTFKDGPHWQLPFKKYPA